MGNNDIATLEITAASPDAIQQSGLGTAPAVHHMTQLSLGANFEKSLEGMHHHIGEVWAVLRDTNFAWLQEDMYAILYLQDLLHRYWPLCEVDLNRKADELMQEYNKHMHTLYQAVQALQQMPLVMKQLAAIQKPLLRLHKLDIEAQNAWWRVREGKDGVLYRVDDESDITNSPTDG